MKVLLPLCAFPPVQWYVSIERNPQAFIDLGEHFVKQSLRNRYEIVTSGGRQWMTIPVTGTNGVKTKTSEIRIYGDAWGNQHFKAIRAAYGRSSFFEHYADALNELLTSGENSLAQFNLSCLQWLATHFNLSCPETLNTYQESWSGSDLRPLYKHPGRVEFPPYVQVFQNRFGFQSNLSILDVVMNEGPATADYIREAGS